MLTFYLNVLKTSLVLRVIGKPSNSPNNDHLINTVTLCLHRVPPSRDNSKYIYWPPHLRAEFCPVPEFQQMTSQRKVYIQ